MSVWKTRKHEMHVARCTDPRVVLLALVPARLTLEHAYGRMENRLEMS